MLAGKTEIERALGRGELGDQVAGCWPQPGFPGERMKPPPPGHLEGPAAENEKNK